MVADSAASPHGLTAEPQMCPTPTATAVSPIVPRVMSRLARNSPDDASPSAVRHRGLRSQPGAEAQAFEGIASSVAFRIADGHSREACSQIEAVESIEGDGGFIKPSEHLPDELTRGLRWQALDPTGRRGGLEVEPASHDRAAGVIRPFQVHQGQADLLAQRARLRRLSLRNGSGGFERRPQGPGVGPREEPAHCPHREPQHRCECDPRRESGDHDAAFTAASAPAAVGVPGCAPEPSP